MKKLFLLPAIAALTLLWSCSKEDNNEEPQPKPVNVACVKVNGHDLIQPDGSKLYVKGVNLGNWLNAEGYMFNFEKRSAHQIDEMFRQLVGPEQTDIFWQDFIDNYITLDDMKYIKSTGANTVRLPLNYKLFSGESYMGSNDPDRGMEILGRVIEWCKETGLYLIIDMHCAPGGNSGDNIDDSYGYAWLYTSESNKKQVCDIWMRIADRCKTEPIVLAYELLNEPISSNHSELYPELHPMMKRITLAIRTVDPNHAVMWGGANYNELFEGIYDPTDGIFISNSTEYDPNVMFACHRYGSDWIEPFVQWRDKTSRPMIMTEWGHGPTGEWQSNFARKMRDNNIGHTVWTYKMIGPWVSSFTTIREPDNWDKIVEFERSPRMNYDDIIAARNRCGQAVARKAMADFIVNSRRANCHKNDSYIRSVGMAD